jgi:hypothetical protein
MALLVPTSITCRGCDSYIQYDDEPMRFETYITISGIRVKNLRSYWMKNVGSNGSYGGIHHANLPPFFPPTYTAHSLLVLLMDAFLENRALN